MDKTQLLIFIVSIGLSLAAYPVAIFHGIGDACENRGMREITEYFSSQLGGVYAKCIESAGGVNDWFTSFISQAKKSCEEIKKDENFQGDFSVVGISQGSLLARYVIESCDMPGRVKRYVSIGGPQMGVAKFPHCDKGIFCSILNKLVDSAIYSTLVQSYIGPSGYFKNNKNYSKYLSHSTFLPELNNEKEEKDSNKKDRFSALEQIVLIKFSKDTMILPKETAWFQFVDEKSQLVELKDSDFYINDYIGVKKLVEENKINFVELEGNHLNFDYDDIDQHMIPVLQ